MVIGTGWLAAQYGLSSGFMGGLPHLAVFYLLREQLIAALCHAAHTTYEPEEFIAP